MNEETKEQYWHIGADDEGASGPFDSIEAAKADARKYLHSDRYHVPEALIVKVVAKSNTTVTFDTQWSPQ